MYAGRMNARAPKKARGRGVIPRERPKPVKGRRMPTAITANVDSPRTRAGRLWMKGIFRVRIMWTIRVCDRRPSTNQPDWKSDWCSGVLALK